MQRAYHTRLAVLFLFALSLALMAGVNLALPSPDEHKSALPQEKAAAPSTAPTGGGYAGSEVCITCHEDQNHRFKNTPMGKVMMLNPRTQEEARGCEGCHGPGQAHMEAGGGKDTIPMRFGKDSNNSVAERNAVCMDCHSSGTHMFWRGSPHESRGMACVNCHQVKQGMKISGVSEARYNYPLTENRGLTKPQPELCLQCHQTPKTMFLFNHRRPSTGIRAT
jgi:hypothetical protein